MFLCDKCGKCCQNLKGVSLYSDLDRGDGICKYFDIEKSLCTIYENRPVKCNVDKMFELYFYNEMSKDEYYRLNYNACKKLKNK